MRETRKEMGEAAAALRMKGTARKLRMSPGEMITIQTKTRAMDR